LIDDIRRRFLKFGALGAGALGAGLLGRAFSDPVSADTSISPSNVTVGNTVLQDGSLAVGASYIIFQEDGRVKARNGTTGVIEFSGTDAAEVIQAAWDSLTAGGKIFLRNGTYLCGSALVLDSEAGNHPVLEGEDQFETVVKAGEDFTRLLDMRNSGFVTVKNLCIDGDNRVTYAVDMTHASQVYTENMLSNVQIKNAANGLELSNTDGNRFFNVQTLNISARGVTWETGASGGLHTFIGCILDGDTAGLDTRNGTVDVYLIACSFGAVNIRNPSKVFVISGYSEGDFYANFTGFHNTSILEVYGGHYIQKNDTNPNVRGTFSTVRIFGGIWSALGTKNIDDTSITNLIVRGRPDLNKDGVWEASGTATILNGNDNVVVSHGLAAAPTNIRVTGSHAEVNNLYVDSVNATSFTIHTANSVTADRIVYWKAEV